VEPDRFDLLSEIRQIEVIATGRGVRIRRYLNERYGSGNWRKLKGRAIIREPDGAVYEAEIHWFQAHGIGKVDWKIKR
jgi:hypothetical protein